MSTEYQPEGGRWTYEEFAKLPEAGPRHEIIANQLYITRVQSPLHQEALSSFACALYEFAESNGLGVIYIGPIDILFAEGDFLEPDIVFVRAARESIITDIAVEGFPDLVVEIVSEDTDERDRGIKRERYAHYGVPEYWVIDPEQHQVEVHRFADRPDAPPLVFSGTFEWQPDPAGPTMILDIDGLLEGYDDLRRIVRAHTARERGEGDAAAAPQLPVTGDRGEGSA